MDAVARFDRAEEVFVVVDAEIGMVAALHQQRGSSDRERLLDLLVDDRLGQEIALGTIARPAVERAEVTVRVADVRVVDVAVDDECDAAGIDLAVAKLVRRPANGDEVAAAQEGERVVVRDPLPGERLVEDLGGRHARTGSVTRKRSSGTRSSSPASRASSKKDIRPARSRGPKLYRSFSK